MKVDKYFKALHKNNYVLIKSFYNATL